MLVSGTSRTSGSSRCSHGSGSDYHRDSIPKWLNPIHSRAANRDAGCCETSVAERPGPAPRLGLVVPLLRLLQSVATYRRHGSGISP
jgi:hypothetical protein